MSPQGWQQKVENRSEKNLEGGSTRLRQDEGPDITVRAERSLVKMPRCVHTEEKNKKS